MPIGDCTGFGDCPSSTLSYQEVAKSRIDIFVIDRVKEKRLEKNLSQADIAFELGMSVGFIGKIESRKYDSHYNLKHLNQLAKILDCSPQDFLPRKAL